MTEISRRGALGAGLALVSASMIRTARAAEGTLRVGAPLPLTGGLAPEAEKQRRGYDLWADTVNSAGGLKVGGDRIKVEVVYSDYQSNTPKAVQLAERLITQDHCSVLFGAMGSGAAKATSSVAERYKIPMVAPSASSKEVYDQGYKFLFGTFTPNATLTEPLGDLVKANVPNVKKVAILARNDLFPLAIADEMQKSAAARGLTVTSVDKYAIGTMDHASALTQMAAAAPEWVFVTGYLNDLILVRRQMVELQFKAPVITMLAGPAYREFGEALGPLADGLTSSAWWHPAVRYTNCAGPWASTEAFDAAFQTRYNREADYGEASAVVAGLVIQLAAEKAGSIDPLAMRDAMASLDAVTFFGHIKFGPDGQVDTLKPPVFQIQDGKRVVLLPTDIKQGDFKLMAT